MKNHRFYARCTNFFFFSNNLLLNCKMKSRSNISSLRFFTKMHPDEKSVHAKDVVEMCLFKKKKKKLKSFRHLQDARVSLLSYLFIFRVFLLSYLDLLVCKSIEERNWQLASNQDVRRDEKAATEGRLRAIGGGAFVRRAISETEIVLTFYICSYVRAEMGDLTDC